MEQQQNYIFQWNWIQFPWNESNNRKKQRSTILLVLHIAWSMKHGIFVHCALYTGLLWLVDSVINAIYIYRIQTLCHSVSGILVCGFHFNGLVISLNSILCVKMNNSIIIIFSFHSIKCEWCVSLCYLIIIIIIIYWNFVPVFCRLVSVYVHIIDSGQSVQVPFKIRMVNHHWWLI